MTEDVSTVRFLAGDGVRCGLELLSCVSGHLFILFSDVAVDCLEWEVLHEKVEV